MKHLEKQRISSLLITINEQLAEVLASDKNISQIEIDLIKDYIRKLYDEVNSLRIQDGFVDTVGFDNNIHIHASLDKETEELINIASNQFEKEPEIELSKLADLPIEKHVEPVIETPKESKVINERKSFTVEENPSSIFNQTVTPKANRSVNDAAMERKEEKTIGEEIRKTAINSLKNYIGINDKFQFINDLFNGKMKNYNESILIFDSIQSKDEALEYLLKLSEEHEWDLESDSVLQFNNYIARRFN